MIIDCIKNRSSHLRPRPTGMKSRLEAIKGVSAVLFDVYGTLFISASGDIEALGGTNDASAFARALKAADFSGDIKEAARVGPDLLREAIARVHKAKKTSGVTYPEVNILELWHRVLSKLDEMNLIETKNNSQGSIDEKTVRLCAVDYECLVNPVWPMPNLSKTISELCKKGIALGIVSNAQFYTRYLFPALLGKNLSELGFKSNLCTWSYEVGEGKPSRRLYDLTLEKLLQLEGIPPEETVFIGNDMLKDIWPAQSARCRTVLFAGDKRSLRLRRDDERCQSIQPDAVVTNLLQILQLVE